MTETKMTIKDGTITIETDIYEVWNNLTDEQREEVMRNDAHWHIVQSSLEYELGKSLATPNFNYSIHNLRQMIVSSPEFVNNITVTFIAQVLTEWGKAEQKRRASDAAFWKLYHRVKDRWVDEDWLTENKIECPSDFMNDTGYMSTDTEEVRQVIMDNFMELLKTRS